MAIRRKILNMPNYKEGDESGWETVRGLGKLDKEYTSPCIKKYCGKSLRGKTFRFSYVEVDGQRYWISNI